MDMQLTDKKKDYPTGLYLFETEGIPKPIILVDGETISPGSCVKIPLEQRIEGVDKVTRIRSFLVGFDLEEHQCKHLDDPLRLMAFICREQEMWYGFNLAKTKENRDYLTEIGMIDPRMDGTGEDYKIRGKIDKEGTPYYYSVGRN